jgi:hypothetical protein
MTGLDPDIRFDKHKAGLQANAYVQRFGLRLLPDLYEAYNPMPHQAAVDMEIELGIGLREAGFGVWGMAGLRGRGRVGGVRVQAAFRFCAPSKSQLANVTFKQRSYEWTSMELRYAC